MHEAVPRHHHLTTLNEFAAFGYCPEAHRRSSDGFDALAAIHGKATYMHRVDRRNEDDVMRWNKYQGTLTLLTYALVATAIVAYIQSGTQLVVLPGNTWGAFAFLAAILAIAVRLYLQQNSGPAILRLGDAVYEARGVNTPPIEAWTEQVRGKPDALVRPHRLRGRNEVRPVKFLTTPVGKPHPSTVLELAAAGLLAQNENGVYPAKGYVLHNDNGSESVVTVTLGEPVRRIVARVAQGLSEGYLHPVSLPVDARCAACPLKDACAIYAAQ